MILAAVVLVLTPVLDADASLRLAASGVGDETVVWILDGVEVAHTGDREAASVPVAAGVHTLEVRSLAQGRWQAVARVDAAGEGAAYVPAWSAVHEPAPALHPDEGGGRDPWRPPMLPLALGGAAVVLLAWPRRRGLEARRRARRR